jgi:hypothetical protein
MTLLVRDEADIVDATIRYHLAQGVDHVIATANRSVDGTREILRAHERAGHLTCLDEPGTGLQQSRWVTRMARLAATDHGADWVINTDADEFWVPADGTLRSTLAAIPADVAVVRFGRTNLPPRPAAGWWADTMVARERASWSTVGRPLPGKAAHRGHPAVTVAEGNHEAAVPGDGLHVDHPGVAILHYPLRSLAQLRRKVEAAREIDYSLRPGIAETWEELVRLDDAGLLAAWFRRQALDDRELHAGLVSGRLVVDRRVQRALHALGLAPGTGSRAG